jgi:hypothetical protein
MGWLLQQKTRPSNAGPGFIPSGLFSDFFYVAASRPAQMTTNVVVIGISELGVNPPLG